MRLRWVLISTIAIGLIVGPLIKDIPGFVVIALGDYTVQTRLWQLIVMVILLQLLFILLYHLVAHAWSSAGNLRTWSGGRRGKKSRQNTINGMIALAEGDWKNSEKLLTKGIQDSDTQLINYLAAARAAQSQKADARRDNYLRQAHVAEPNAEIAIGLTQAHLQLNHGQYEQALATLTHLKNLAPKHEHVLFLLQNLYRQLGDWNGFLGLVKDLKKVSALSSDKLTDYQIKAWQQLLQGDADSGGVESLHSLWMTIPKPFQKQKQLISRYSELLIIHGGQLEAEKILRTNIKKEGDEQYIYLYGKVQADDLSKQLAFAESLSKKFPSNATLLLSIGRICLNMELWGKARSSLEKSVEMTPLPEVYFELARAYEALGNHQDALMSYKNGLAGALLK